MKKAKQLAAGTDATLDGILSLSESAGGASSVVSKEVIYAQNTSAESLKLETTLSLRAVFAVKN